MSRSLNKACLLGNVGNAPEVRSTQNGTRVASFSLATGKQWIDSAGTIQEKTEWHRCVAWNSARGSGLADLVETFVGKGSKLYVEGEIQYRQYQDRDGQTRYVTEIQVRDLLLLDARSIDDANRPTQQQTQQQTQPAKAKTAPADDFTDFPADDTDR